MKSDKVRLDLQKNLHEKFKNVKSHENTRVKILLAAECQRRGCSAISFEKSASNCLKFDALAVVFIVSKSRVHCSDKNKA
jgi:hypothetical protein